MRLDNAFHGCGLKRPPIRDARPQDSTIGLQAYRRPGVVDRASSTVLQIVADEAWSRLSPGAFKWRKRHEW